VPGSLHHFAFDPIPSPQTAGEPFSVTITAQDAHGNTVTGYTGTATLTDTTGTLSPTTSGAFVSGVWTGSVSVAQAAADVSITAQDGVAGASNVFEVMSPEPTEYTIFLPVVMRNH
jgi:hypothetical protein